MKIAREVFISITRIQSLYSLLFSSPVTVTSSPPSTSPPLFTSRQSIHEAVSLIYVQGCNLSDSSVHPNSVLLRMNKQPKDSRLIENDASLRLLQNFWSSYSHHSHRLSRIVLVQNVIPTPGYGQSSDGGGGGSQSADELQNQISYIFNIQSSSSALPSSSSSSSSPFPSTLQQLQAIHSHSQSHSYLDLFLSSLLNWKVQMILCPEPIPLQVLDLCAANQIIILPCSVSALTQLSGLLQIEIVEDIVDLTDGTVSDDSKYEIVVKILDPVRVIDNEDGVQEGASLFSQQESTLFILTVKERSVPSLTPTATTVVTYLPEYRPHTVVVLRCPSAISGYQLHDRILRCLSRLSHLVCPRDDYCGSHLHISSSPQVDSHCPQLLCGGGLVELLCAMECSNLWNRHKGEGEGKQGKDSLLLLRSLQYVFERFVQTINLNNGATEASSLTLWEESQRGLREAVDHSRHEAAFAAQESESVIRLVSELPAHLKWNLVAPVTVGEEFHTCDRRQSPHPPLDIFSIKRDMIQTALYTVRLILSTGTIEHRD
jgi:hypothetical protein